MMEIKIWMQLFFEDGTCSQGIRFPANLLDHPEYVFNLQQDLLRKTTRDSGLMVIWGAGNLMHGPVVLRREEKPPEIE